MPALVSLRHWVMVVLAGSALGAGPLAYQVGLVTFKAWWAEDSVVAALREARALARSRGQPVRVLVDEEMRSVWVEGGHWRKLPDGVSLAGPRADADGRGAIVFRPDGTSGGGQIVVSWRGRAVSVMVDGDSGRLRRVRAGSPMPQAEGARLGSAG
ncbi:MAG TPA: GspH/FimT family pseudopilin [Magnetospirillum sp.]|nr:GspH/FimT family pseudopilin [Magnetospirillum sp.]